MGRRFTAVLVSVACVSAVPCLAHAEESRREDLVMSPASLASRLDDPDLVLLHVGDKAEYERAHLPGARYVSLRDLSDSNPGGAGLHLEMPSAADLRARLEDLGISDRSRIVVYYASDWVSPAARVVFTLDYAGLGSRTTLLDGGQQAWVREGRKVTAEVPPARHGTLAPLTLRPLVVDADYVRAHLGAPGIAVVDARAASYYDGVETGGMKDHPHRTGHIAGAVSVPFSEIADEQLMLRSETALRALFERAGVKAGDTVIGYCHIGQQATAMLFAARTLGHPVLLYDGSFEDWSRHEGWPVEAVPAR